MAKKNDELSQTAIARKYRKKEPEMSMHKLARIMYNENPLAFPDKEGARYALRRIEGKTGKVQQSKTPDKSLFREEARPLNPYNLPASDEDDYLPYILTGKKILVLPDIHAPYHSISALTAVIDYGKSVKPDTILLNGDLLDCHKLSKYEKDPRKKNFDQEVAIASEIILLLKKHLCENIIFKIGNHDQRYQHFLWTKAGEIAGLEDFELHNILTKRCGPIVTVTDKRIIKAGHLNIVHGHEFIGGAGVPASVAKSFYDKGKTSVLGGHHHKTSEFTAVDMNGNMTTAYSSGCLSELHPQYMPINQWNQGAAFVQVENNTFHVHNFRIDKGKIY